MQKWSNGGRIVISANDAGTSAGFICIKINLDQKLASYTNVNPNEVDQLQNVKL